MGVSAVAKVRLSVERTFYREISTPVDAQAAFTSVRLYRHGNTVTAILRNVGVSGAPEQVKLLSPENLAGLLPIETVQAPVARMSASGVYVSGGVAIVHPSGLYWRPSTNSGTFWSQISWVTNDSWPA